MKHVFSIDPAIVLKINRCSNWAQIEYLCLGKPFIYLFLRGSLMEKCLVDEMSSTYSFMWQLQLRWIRLNFWIVRYNSPKDEPPHTSVNFELKIEKLGIDYEFYRRSLFGGIK